MPTRYTEAELNEQKPAKWGPVVVAGIAVSLFFLVIGVSTFFMLANYGTC